MPHCIVMCPLFTVVCNTPITTGSNKKLSYRRENSASAVHIVVARLLSVAVITETYTC